jgi:hypothetical protein
VTADRPTDPARRRPPGPSQRAWLVAFRRLCAERDRTPEDVAQTVGLDGLVGRLEAEEEELLLQHQALLCAELGVPLSRLLELAEESERRR